MKNSFNNINSNHVNNINKHIKSKKYNNGRTHSSPLPLFPPLTCTCSVLETCMENNNKLWRCVSSEGTEDGMVEAVKVVVVAGKERDDDMRLVQKVLLYC